MQALGFGFLLGALALLFPKQARTALPNIISMQPEAEFTSGDLDTMARTIWGEARNEGQKGMQAVANVIMNRYEAAQRSTAKARQYGFTVEQICKKPYQFSVWNAGDPNLAKMLEVTESDSRFSMALDIAAKALNGRLSDITGGADHYLNISFTKEIRGGSLPSWADLNKKTAAIGAHTFLRLG